MTIARTGILPFDGLRFGTDIPEWAMPGLVGIVLSVVAVLLTLLWHTSGNKPTPAAATPPPPSSPRDSAAAAGLAYAVGGAR